MAVATDEEIFKWLDELCMEAKGDVLMVNRLSKNDAFAYYFTNVFSLHSLTPKTFANMTVMDEARRWHAEYTEAEERKVAEVARDGKIAALETQLAEVLTLLKEQKVPVTPPPKKGAKITPNQSASMQAQDEMDNNGESE